MYVYVMLCHVMLCCAFVPLATSVFRLPLSRCSSCTCTSALGLGVAIPTLHYGVHYTTHHYFVQDRERRRCCAALFRSKACCLPRYVLRTVCRRSPDEKRNHVNRLLISLVRSTPYRMEPEKAGAKNTYPQLLQSHVWLVCKSIFCSYTPGHQQREKKG